ncbi:hypothetical protein LJB93_00325 [Desulfovibrio sp. OttesenSCG-928-F07]|nr:hypothetical protein [Desulfovibrio sp. OttesenSCG-928-F07]
MQKVNFVKLSPGGNTTILLNAQDTPPQKRAEVANMLMNNLHLGAEQVGFTNYTAAPPRLDMMGGEFCLNATRCLVYEMLHKKMFFPLQGTEDLFGLVQSSGINTPLQVRIKNGKTVPDSGQADCMVSILAENSPKNLQELEPGLTLVHVPGISHLLVNLNVYPQPQNPLDEAKKLIQRFNLQNLPACGVIFYQEQAASKPAPSELLPPSATLQSSLPNSGTFINCTIIPVVYVAATNSFVAETACGSGTMALAIALAKQAELIFLSVLQPSGETLRVKLEQHKITSNLCRLEVGGKVSLIARGTTYLHSL